MPVETSLIIITRHRPALLAEALASIGRQERRVDDVVVVDNGPSEATAEAVSRFQGSLPVRYFAEPRRGYGIARNCGVSEARGRVLLFLDDDCLADRDWTRTLLADLESGAADIVGGSRICTRPGLAAHLDYLSTDAPVLDPGRARGPASHLSTSNLAMRRTVSERVGPFDEQLSMCEDRDFCARARAQGFRLLYDPAARVAHQPPLHGFSDYLHKMEQYGLGTSQYFLKHREEEPLARIFPRSAAARLLMLPALAAMGTAYLVAKNLRHRPEAIALSPLLLLGQFFWHWGGYLATREVSAFKAS